jgi:hypothetical protein
LIIYFVIVMVSTLSVYYITNSELSVIGCMILGLVAWFVGKDAIVYEKFRNRTNF